MSGVPYCIREIVQRHRVTILVYHKPQPEAADRQFAALRQKYSIISLAEYLGYREEPEKHLPPKPLIVTLDDGYKTNYALTPILKKHGIRATIFLCSGLVGTNRHFWFETAMNRSLREKLKRLPDSKRLAALAEMGFSEATEQALPQALSEDEIEEMKQVVDFQSHTVYHPMLQNCPESRALEEISDSKSQLERKLGLVVNALAYPNGEYSAREIEAAKRSGYKCAVSMDCGFNSRTTPAFQLKRFCMNDDGELDELLVKASGLWAFLKTYTEGVTRLWPTSRNKRKCAHWSVPYEE